MDDVPLRMLCFARLDCKAEAGEEEEEQLVQRRPWWFKALTSDQTRMIRQGLLRGMEYVFWWYLRFVVQQPITRISSSRIIMRPLWWKP
jgi:hypothetical protein